MNTDTDTMQLAHLADTHLGHRQYGLRRREDDMVSTFATTLTEITEAGVDALVLPGDLFHSRDLRPKSLDAAETALRERVPDDVPVLVSRGNHDENLAPRNVTWLNYLHRRGCIVLLEAELNAESGTVFDRYDPDEPGEHAGFFDLPTDGPAGPIRVFGLQWRGARTEEALDTVARGIRTTNDRHGEPGYTVLLGHFGMEDEVPALGGTITHSDLRELRELVDYLALGHIHKRYDAAGWVHNPGSPEAHDTREGRDDWEHGYYTVDIGSDPDTNANADGRELIADDPVHHPTKRRAYHRIEFDVTAHDSPGDLEAAFRDHVRGERDALDARCARPVHTKRDGKRRRPLIDLRLTGTLQFSRADLRLGELSEWTEDECDALYVRTTAGIRTADVEALLSELEDDDAFVDGRLNTAALERRVFETIAAESEYGERADGVADVLERAHTMARNDETTAEVANVVRERRRDLFPEMADDTVVEVPEDPFADESGETDEAGEADDTDENEPDDSPSEAVAGGGGSGEGNAEAGLGAFAGSDGGETE